MNTKIYSFGHYSNIDFIYKLSIYENSYTKKIRPVQRITGYYLFKVNYLNICGLRTRCSKNGDQKKHDAVNRNGDPKLSIVKPVHRAFMHIVKQKNESNL